nr:hypothetical protein Iba_scaffold13673CG0150 [Ipomoea batatas]
MQHTGTGIYRKVRTSRTFIAQLVFRGQMPLATMYIGDLEPWISSAAELQCRSVLLGNSYNKRNLGLTALFIVLIPGCYFLILFTRLSSILNGKPAVTSSTLSIPSVSTAHPISDSMTLRRASSDLVEKRCNPEGTALRKKLPETPTRLAAEEEKSGEEQWW